MNSQPMSRFVLLTLLIAVFASQTPAAERPNVLWIYLEDVSGWFSSYGEKLIETPNIDALASESVVFDRAYTPTALCSPARASLMTGIYPHRHHMFNNSTPGYSFCEHLRPEVSMLPEWADDETDYETAYFGKWHIGPAEDLFKSRFHRTHPRPYEGGPPFLLSDIEQNSVDAFLCAGPRV